MAIDNAAEIEIEDGNGIEVTSRVKAADQLAR
jgi:hypothetical protein